MLTEHNNRSIEDKPNIDQIRKNMRFCCITVVNRMLQPAKSFSVSELLHVSHPQPSKTAHHKSTQVQLGTTQKIQRKQLQKRQRSKLGLRSNNSEFFDFSAQLYDLLKSEFFQNIEVKRPRVDHGQHCSKKALNRSTQKTESPKQISA